MTKRILRAGATLAAILVPAAASAHGGHDAAGLAAGLLHPFTGADHLLAMVLVGLWAGMLGGRAIWVVPTAFVGVLIAGAALGAQGVGLPGVEQVIAASVFILGLLVAVQLRAPTPAAAALVGGFALFHGFAHGAEIPAEASGLAFGAGFVISTAALHLAGIGLGFALSSRRALRLAGGAAAGAGLVPGLIS